MPEFTKLVLAELLGHTVEIREKEAGKTGVANTCENGVAVFCGDDDGGDDKTVSIGEFNQEFEITAIICK